MKAGDHSLKLPEVIAAYWAAANAGRSEAAAAFFSADAVVHDEGQCHRGTAAIRAWIEVTTQKYQPVVEPLGVKLESGKHLIAARVSGTFPGSPVELDYEFTLQDGKVRSLEVK